MYAYDHKPYIEKNRSLTIEKVHCVHIQNIPTLELHYKYQNSINRDLLSDIPVSDTSKLKT